MQQGTVRVPKLSRPAPADVYPLLANMSMEIRTTVQAFALHIFVGCSAIFAEQDLVPLFCLKPRVDHAATAGVPHKDISAEMLVLRFLICWLSVQVYRCPDHSRVFTHSQISRRYGKLEVGVPSGVAQHLRIAIGALPLPSGPACRARYWAQGFEYHCRVGGPIGR